LLRLGINGEIETAIQVATQQHTEAAIQAATQHILATTQQHTEAAIQSLRRELSVLRNLISYEFKDVIYDAPSNASEINLDPLFYIALEDKFRGPFDEIKERVRPYLADVLPHLDAQHPLIDLGCGRGEWLTLLSENGINAIGVDSNPASIAELKSKGLTAHCVDLVDYLHSASSGSVGAITMFHVIEHLPIDVLLHVLSETLRVLRPGGIFIAETPNSLSLSVGASTFWLDPTHQRPLHPEFVKFVAAHTGFKSVEGRFMNRITSELNDILDSDIRALVEQIYGYGDFALLAWN
jgi:O-antigen chain-terminating methyltransferase